MRFAGRISHIGVSGVRDFFDKGRRIPNAIDLSIGQADFDVPEPVKDATIAAIQGRCGRYSPTPGYPEVVAATKRHLRDRFGLDEDEEVMLTSGATGAISLAMLALVGPGDEVLIPDPYFVMYPNLVHVVGGTPVAYDLYPDFRLRVEEVEARMTERTRLVILNSPSNPTGATYDPGDLEAVARLCRERGVMVLSDELYALFSYDSPHTSIKRYLKEESLLVGGVSKAYGMAGWRLGWAAGAPELIDKMKTLQQFVYTCPPTLVQLGALAAFDVDPAEHVQEYRRKRDLVDAGLRAAGYGLVRPTGSFFAFPQVPWGTDQEFCDRALAHKLILVPGRSFSRRQDHFRLSFGAPGEALERAVEILGELARER